MNSHIAKADHGNVFHNDSPKAQKARSSALSVLDRLSDSVGSAKILITPAERTALMGIEQNGLDLGHKRVANLDVVGSVFHRITGLKLNGFGNAYGDVANELSRKSSRQLKYPRLPLSRLWPSRAMHEVLGLDQFASDACTRA